MVIVAGGQLLSFAAPRPATSVLGTVGTVWGGQHLRLEVTADGANLEFDCATGTITGAPEPDAQGKFTIAGTLVRELPGPTMREGNPAAPVKYSGTIQGETLLLVVSVEGSGEPYGEYSLVRGKPGRVVKCR
jgi:hypothetical protein